MRTSVLLIALLCTACVAPGSSIGRIALSGTIETSKPLSLEVTLPKHYGLGGLDSVMNKPEDFGHKDKRVMVEVRDRIFSHEFEPIVYHISFWLLPPLGTFPKHPPAPVYSVTFSNAPGEVYLVGMDGDDFRYEVYDKASRERLAHEEASWLLISCAYISKEAGDKKVWHLQVEAKPNKSLQPTSGRDAAFLG